MISSPVSVRFAPSPSGFMHLGNVRAALINFLYARQHNGTFILRIEDTDASRTTQTYLNMIGHDLTWLNLTHDEGPDKPGPHAPYLQSACTELYARALTQLVEHGHAYRCFCTQQELEALREEQRSRGMPPRYDRRCRNLSQEDVDRYLAAGKPYIWRFALPSHTIEIVDRARGTITYDLQDFSDFALTRQDGSFTFLFANAVDDIRMHITDVIRGEDHLSNTALQAALYEAFGVQTPLFYHLPIICNEEGHKLSKRDFGFSLNDLRDAGFLPEAITNYLCIIGGSFDPEIMSLQEMITLRVADRILSTGTIQYDLAKLRWMNAQWMKRLGTAELYKRIRPILEQSYGHDRVSTYPLLSEAIGVVTPECHTLHDLVKGLSWCFVAPEGQTVSGATTRAALEAWLEGDVTLDALKTLIGKTGAKTRDVFVAVRKAITGSEQGLGMAELISCAPADMIRARVMNALLSE